MTHKKNLVVSQNCNIYLLSVEKPSLSPFNNGRQLLDDGITSKAYVICNCMQIHGFSD